MISLVPVNPSKRNPSVVQYNFATYAMHLLMAGRDMKIYSMRHLDYYDMLQVIMI